MSDNKTSLLHLMTVPISLRFLRGQIAYMKANGFEVEVLSSPGKLLNEFGNEEGVRTHAIDIYRMISPFKDIATIMRLLKLFREKRYDIVHTHTPKAGLVGMIAASLADSPIKIYHVHGLPFMTQVGLKRKLLLFSEWVSCHLADQVYCVSPSIKQILIEEKLCQAEKIKVLNHGSINGVDAEGLFNPDSYVEERKTRRHSMDLPEDALVVGFVGRLVQDKGIYELISAWQQLKEKYQHLYLLLIGPAEERDSISTKALETLSQDNRIRMVGFVENLQDMPKFYSIMDMVVLPSYREGFPVTPLEAAAMQLPVITTQIPGCVDAVVDDKTGQLVEVANVDELVDAIQHYVTNPDLRHLHGRNGRLRVLQDFKPQDIWVHQLKEYRHLLTS
ncbi:glycosyltransferase family 4 protein [Phototrophicus methaneseepsis]|uniref:Glycosyltransferase family 4 protein n=1 Tax=Phototrophicus methaneseepsis TaxID=2710758 RepID=A0A7S8IDY5_9CHLR|nr:glycosyltransferase family 4 protein [Phototrophicus methaneseepsis]QPC82036.1 glycosyltransferase family 4 protein [Phototrophicus methaneseepsis]